MRTIRRLACALTLAAALIAGSASYSGAAAPTDLAQNLQVPWHAAFLPDGTALVTERTTGRIWSISPTGAVTVAATLPEVRPAGEAGLLGLAVSPSYATDGLLYVYYSTAADNRIVRLRLGGIGEPILTGIPVARNHNGGRLAFGPDGYLYASTGDANNGSAAQNLNSLGGKILRMTTDGDPAPGNPFPDSVVWSYGHRNVQGLAWDTAGHMYASEFGQSRFDELNRIQPGGNYGWPIVEGDSTDSRFVRPLVTWSPDDASPSGIAVRGSDVYVACLHGAKLYRVRVNADGDVEGEPEPLVSDQFGRLRHVVVAPDNALWVLTSNRDGRGTPRPNDDRVIRLDL